MVLTNIFEIFAASFGSIVLSELGDKTFFIAAIMAMRYSRAFVLIGAISALIIMTVLSCAFGVVIPKLIPKKWTIFISMLLFLFFGLKLLWEVYKNEKEEDEEAEVELQIISLEDGLVKKQDANHQEEKESLATNDEQESTKFRKISKSLFSDRMIFWQAFTLTFLAEWGDRSQYTTIALAATYNPFAVCLGAIIGHSICSGLAVFVGKLLSKRISERFINLIGGVLFLLFGLISMVAFINYNENEEEQEKLSIK